MDEIKRALMGDKEAQRRFTERGELLPCPLCGWYTIVDGNFVDDDGYFFAHIFCPNCHLEIVGSDETVEEKNKLIKKWNTRLQILTDEEMERLEGMG